MTASSSADSPDEAVHGFNKWLSDTTVFFKKLPDEEKNNTLYCLISACGATQLSYLHNSLESLLYRDFLTLLPPELVEHLLLYFDSESLLVACSVNSKWNEIVSASSKCWQKACEDNDLIINKQLRSGDGLFWKSYFLEMSFRQNQMKHGASFENQIYTRDQNTITAVYYYNGRLATATENNRVQLWDCSTDKCLTTLHTEASVSSIKFDDRILIVSSYLGHLVSWDINSGRRNVEYLRHVGAVFSFDYSDDLGVVISGSADTKIKVWSLPMGTLLTTLQNHNLWVLKVLLKPLPKQTENDFQHRHSIFSMDKSLIIVWDIGFGTKDGKPGPLCISSLYNIPIHTTNVDYLLFTPGLHFDGTYLYFVRQDSDDTHKLPSLCKWNTLIRRMENETVLDMKVKLFIGIGRKYAAFLTPHRNRPNFVVIDVNTKKEVALAELPPSRPATPDCSQITIGESDWLNGLDGKNDTGILLAAGLNNKTVYLIKWISRLNH